jgi:hypothetical protein
MRIDAVDKIELFIELFERHAEQRAADEDACPSPKDLSSQLISPRPESSLETTTLAEMLAPAPTVLEAFSRNWHGQNDRRDVPIDRLVRFLEENAESIEQDAPPSAKLLHYVYPIV